MYLFMCMNIKLGIREQRNTSIVTPCRQGVNLGLTERILNTLYIFEFCPLQLYIPPYSKHKRPVLEHLLFSNPEVLSPTAELECTLCLQDNSTQFNLCIYFSEGVE
jgi:hypothetical protein